MSTTTTKPIDFSSLPQDQQQQLQQLQLQFQEHQQQQQKAAAEAAKQAAEQQAQQFQQQYHQDYAVAQSYDPSQVQPVYDPSQVQPAYDPSQVQTYDQSYYAAYYQYQDPNQVQNPQPELYQQQHYAYYQPDYANVYQQQPQLYPQPESAQIHLPAVHEQPQPAVREQQQQQQQPQPPPQPQQQLQPPPQQHQYSQTEPGAIHQPGPVHAIEPSRPVAGPPPVGLGQVQVQHQKNAYYPQQVGPGGDPNVGSPAVPPGLNPAAAAAVAALSQLTQFAGTMDAAERAMAGLQERQLYGRAGGYGPGGFPGQYMAPEPVRPSQAGRSPFRGRGGGRTSQHRGGGSSGGGGRGGGRSSSGPPSRGRGRGRGRGGGPHRPPHGGVSSSAADASEESSEEEPEPPAGNQVGPTILARCEICKADCNSLEMLEKHNNGKRHKKNLQKLEEQKTAYQPPPTGPKLPEVPETAQEGEVNKPTEPENLPGSESKTETANRVENQRQGMKRSMRGGGNGAGKRARTFDAPPRRPIEPHKPKVVIPLICELCNVKCDTREVFNCHLSGKKHISKLKRFDDHQAMYGPSGLQALYPPNPISQNYAQGPPQAYHGPQAYPHQAPPLQNNYPLQFVGQNSAQGQISAVQMYGGNGVNPPSGI